MLQILIHSARATLSQSWKWTLILNPPNIELISLHITGMLTLQVFSSGFVIGEGDESFGQRCIRRIINSISWSPANSTGKAHIFVSYEARNSNTCPTSDNYQFSHCDFKILWCTPCFAFSDPSDYIYPHINHVRCISCYKIHIAYAPLWQTHTWVQNEKQYYVRIYWFILKEICWEPHIL